VSKTDLHIHFTQALKTMDDAGFAVAHVRGNSHGSMFNVGNYQVPDIIEVTYVRKPSAGCSREGGRPSYDKAAAIQEKKRLAPEKGLTAAAAPAVAEDVGQDLSLGWFDSHGLSLVMRWPLALCLAPGLFLSF